MASTWWLSLVRGLQRGPFSSAVKTVTYTPQAGSAVSVTGLWSEDETLRNYVSHEEHETQRGVFRADSADLPRPDVSATVTLDGATWAVVSIGKTSPRVELQLETRQHRRLLNVENRRS